MADTFEALGRDEQALKDTIAKSPADARRGRRVLPRPAPVPHRPDRLLEGLRRRHRGAQGRAPAARRRRPGRHAGAAAPARRSTRRPRRRSVQLRELAEAPGTNAALRGVTATVTTLNPQLRFLGPYVTVCNSWNYFFTYLAEHFSEPDTTGSAQRALVNITGRQEDSLGSMGADEPANGEGRARAAPRSTPQDQPYGAAVAPDGRADCETGQRGFVERDARFFPSKYKIARDPRSPGLQGPTFTGRPRVPRGPDLHRRARDRRVRRHAGVGAPVSRRSNAAIGLIALVVITVVVLLRLVQADPAAVALRDQGGVRDAPTTSARGSPVRIAGVEVGKVIERRARRVATARS